MCVFVCARVCVQPLPPADPKEGSGSFSVPAAASLQAASSVNKQAPPPARLPAPAPAPRPGGAPPATARGNLLGRPAAVPGLACLPGSESGRRRRVPAARAGGRAPSRAGRRAWPTRPASWGLGRRRRRRSEGTPRPPSRRPAPGRALGLCHCTCPGARGAWAARPGRAPCRGVSRPRRGLAPCAPGSPQAPPGRPRALGLTRLGYGAGEVGAGSLRGPSGAVGAGVLSGSRGAGRGGVGTRVPAPCPPTRLRAPGDIRPLAEHGWCKAAAAATSFPPRR